MFEPIITTESTKQNDSGLFNKHEIGAGGQSSEKGTQVCWGIEKGDGMVFINFDK